MAQERIPPTVGLNLAKIEKRRAKFIFWDVGGQPVLRKIWEKYYSQCNAVIFVVDGANEARLDEAQRVIEKLYSEQNPTELVDLPVLFLINKSDHENWQGLEHVRDYLGISSLHCNSHVEVRAISIKSKEGVEDSANWLYDNIPTLSMQAKQAISEGTADMSNKRDVVDNV